MNPLIQMHKAVVLVSGGIDSVTVLYLVRQRGYACHVLTVNYGQRAAPEIECAKHHCLQLEVCEHRIVEIRLNDIACSALTRRDIDMPQGHDPTIIPDTYVPARNTIFLSLAFSYAESIGAKNIFFGAHVVDYSNYPDCRPEFLNALTHAVRLGTKQGNMGDNEFIEIHTPLLYLNKAEIIRLGMSLGIDYSKTISCYDTDTTGAACGTCPSCTIRKEGFLQADLTDPTRYQK